ncbi:MAG TPA: hypothetical protein VF960_09840 [Chloroflexota bacterium]
MYVRDPDLNLIEVSESAQSGGHGAPAKATTTTGDEPSDDA